MNLRSCVTLLALLALVHGSLAHADATPVRKIKYHLDIVGDFGGNESQLLAINAHGFAVGYSRDRNGVRQPLMFFAGKTHRLRGFTIGDVQGLNSSDDLVGFGTDANGNMRGFKLENLAP